MADSLTYLSIDGLIDSIESIQMPLNGGSCVAYFDGKYPTPCMTTNERYVESLKEHTLSIKSSAKRKGMKQMTNKIAYAPSPHID